MVEGRRQRWKEGGGEGLQKAKGERQKAVGGVQGQKGNGIGSSQGRRKVKAKGEGEGDGGRRK